MSSVLFSSIIDNLFSKIGRKGTFSLGFLFVLGSSVALAFLEEDSKYFMYPVSFFIGASQALLLNTAVTLISEVIGVKGSSGAFVFGCYSFVDKLSSGIALFTITILP